MKKKILVIADSPLVPSGVGTQTKYMIEAMLRTGEFSFLCLAGAIKHKDYTPTKVGSHGDDWIIHPVDGYGDPETIRQIFQTYKPDVVWFMTDPRFFIWLWKIEDQIRKLAPMVYYHVWDNYPYPLYNKDFYESNDVVCTISKVTDDIVRTVAPSVKTVRIPHTVDTEIFKKRNASEYREFKKHANSEGKLVFFWNNRNARRKQSGTLLFWFKDFLDKIGHDKAMLIMHTEPKDPNGQDLETIIKDLGLIDGQVQISVKKLTPHRLSCMYNMADCTINISDAEGFGLSTLESLACETPIIVSMTGGLQEQVTDGEEYFGIGIKPVSSAIIGSQDVPYIYEDRIAKESFLLALEDFVNKTEEERAIWGSNGRKHVLKNYGMAQYAGLWYQTFQEIFEKFGSWDTRQGYKKWEICSL